jgi:hypothetical protein
MTVRIRFGEPEKSATGLTKFSPSAFGIGLKMQLKIIAEAHAVAAKMAGKPDGS